MEGFISILIFTAIIGVFDLAANRFGADSRDLVIDASRPAPAAGLTVR